MSIRLDGPWHDLTADNVARLTAHLGVYGIRDGDGAIVFLGAATARSLFGLRQMLEGELARGDGYQFAYEITTQYTSRLAELLMVHRADHGVLPADNEADPPHVLGRLSPA